MYVQKIWSWSIDCAKYSGIHLEKFLIFMEKPQPLKALVYLAHGLVSYQRYVTSFFFLPTYLFVPISKTGITSYLYLN